MLENNSSDKVITSFDCNENVSMADLLKDYDLSLENINLGKELDVTIIEENSDGFMVNLGMKSDGIIPKSEFEDGKIPDELKVGATVKVKFINNQGRPILSYKAIVEEAKWNELEESFKQSKHIRGTILKATKSGFFVDISGVRSFLPVSQVDIRFVKDVNSYIGQTYDFIIIGFYRSKKNVVLSRRKLLQEAKDVARTDALKKIEEGQIIDGTISNITKFGAFVDLNGVAGLLHIGELAWYKVKKVEDLLHIEQQIRVQVLKVDKSSGKISLSMKNLAPHPWDNADERLPIGLVTKGVVTSIVDYGVFVEIEPGIEGLLHLSEYAWNNSAALLKKEIKKGQEIEVKIISVDKATKKIALSVKQIQESPWDVAFKHYTPGTKVKGVIANIMPFGAFVKLGEGVEGLIHISDFSWTKTIKNPESMLKKGDEVEVIILEVNPKNERISLSLKHVQEDPYKKYKIGNVVKGKVVRVVDYGAYVELESEVEAFIRNNEFSSMLNERSQSLFKEGQGIEAKIIKVDLKNRKIEISIKRLELEREKDLIKQYSNQNSTVTLGETLSEE
ncbi:MAG: S1 RNA-binding domain-containing protein [Endomicrobium sp.]|jgi:small subunit ribosomal protein S1|nr:S1 RNA-binding domain-containing protein [Endomicrobium sp.]